ncbi:dihydroorotate dehydrogenase B catalytic subunit [candidate division WOR-1 bacterium RIFCSPHIGHO2_01_FULL_53_15]|uniref:Dihydroorotate dehydrogenase n=1 Tax=candidate division WOR-1 bacterium RIFCSPHIGHO2_01_FULL_53_15 TaxID=1802564 RepID=A0A1F4Q388_UNCSA|nr:MAG: dihydroorotate dehydrogenase B catalytic subunit [candidate division WOR-1 bacterium RIFCSPHIGHO2_01_FULL_53_15]OGC12661.1 MAG: dihydroorotate dehydrogenase B catalytic subunit [candidate division WOR-1 bacterium RIFCSPHIGHO2_02_FULL_53_26]
MELAGIKMKNPVMVASGTFGFGKDFADYIDLNKLGAIVTKSVTLKPREGNPPPRIVETPSGMLNSIGLQNKGIEHFLKKQLPFLAKFDTPTIVNIAGESVEDYAELARILSQETTVKGIEVNISCPNVKKGGMSFGCDAGLTKQVIAAVRKATTQPIIAKLTPNVADITLPAKAAAEGGADALSLINTIVGMSIDIETGGSRLGSLTGGLSGPAIRPIAVRLVYEAARAVKIPVIGIGGIMSGSDAVEFFHAGAKAVQVGTANFVDTSAAINVIKEIEEYVHRHPRAFNFS